MRHKLTNCVFSSCSCPEGSLWKPLCEACRFAALTLWVLLCFSGSFVLMHLQHAWVNLHFVFLKMEKKGFLLVQSAVTSIGLLLCITSDLLLLSASLPPHRCTFFFYPLTKTQEQASQLHLHSSSFYIPFDQMVKSLVKQTSKLYVYRNELWVQNNSMCGFFEYAKYIQ